MLLTTKFCSVNQKFCCSYNKHILWLKQEKISECRRAIQKEYKEIRRVTVGESRQPWAGVCLRSFFKKYERKNLEYFT